MSVALERSESDQTIMNTDVGPLGRATKYVETYTPSLLHSMPRRDQPFSGLGEDVWTGYEFSWLNTQGKPEVAALRLRVNCDSACLVESKSMKLYLGSFAQTKFESRTEVMQTLDQDLAMAFRAPVIVEVLELQQIPQPAARLPGRSLDDLDVRTQTYTYDQSFLSVDRAGAVVHETLHSHLFRSLCPVTGQPDWASLSVEYRGQPIDEEGLLKYLISFRQHAAFHESTVELIFSDILNLCEPEALSVNARFQRRGGLDINPFRSNQEQIAPEYRMLRQ